MGQFAYCKRQAYLENYGITSGVLVLDESDRARSKNTKRIHKAHKQKHKASGGYVNGQTVVLLLLVTDSITVGRLNQEQPFVQDLDPGNVKQVLDNTNFKDVLCGSKK